MAENQQDWPHYLPGILMSFRMSPSTQSSELSPFQIVFGKEMNLPFDISLIPKDRLNKDAKIHVTALMTHLRYVKALAEQNSMNAKTKQKEHHDKKSTELQFQLYYRTLLC